MVVEAVLARLAPDILAGLRRGQAARTGPGSGAGARRKGNRRGRPLPARPGRLDGRNRLDILATLRAAAPWQTIRRMQTPDRAGLLLRPSDFRLRRYESRSDRLVIFAVDASGSAAITRLNEAKGAVELLLGQAYAARDHVALISFRGERAECLLQPTRSLVQTKRKLGALPGGGGTPLAAGLREALEVALQARRRGMTPIIVLITDGKGNIALDGTADRSRARDDARTMARHLRQNGLGTLVIDIGARPQPALRDLAQHLDGDYTALPRADAHRMSEAVQTVLDRA
jgi:magnesium chelatase subunit D